MMPVSYNNIFPILPILEIQDKQEMDAGRQWGMNAPFNIDDVPGKYS